MFTVRRAFRHISKFNKHYRKNIPQSIMNKIDSQKESPMKITDKFSFEILTPPVKSFTDKKEYK